MGGEDPRAAARKDMVGDEAHVLPAEVPFDDLATPGTRGPRAHAARREDRERGRVLVRTPSCQGRRVQQPARIRASLHDGEHGPQPDPSGYLADDRVQSAIDWLVDHQLPDGGWDCFGRKEGTLDAWEAMSAFAEIPPRRRTADVRSAIEAGAEFFLRQRLLHEGPRFYRWYWLRYPWHYFYDVLVGLDFMTALGYGKDLRMREALDHLRSKRLPDGRWKLDHTNGNLVIEPRGKPSKMITFLALRVLRRAAKT